MLEGVGPLSSSKRNRCHSQPNNQGTFMSLSFREQPTQMSTRQAAISYRFPEYKMVFDNSILPLDLSVGRKE
jgi:hypothetical protein